MICYPAQRENIEEIRTQKKRKTDAPFTSHRVDRRDEQVPDGGEGMSRLRQMNISHKLFTSDDRFFCCFSNDFF